MSGEIYMPRFTESSIPKGMSKAGQECKPEMPAEEDDYDLSVMGRTCRLPLLVNGSPKTASLNTRKIIRTIADNELEWNISERNIL